MYLLACKNFLLKNTCVFVVSVLRIQGWVAELSPFGKEILNRLSICSLCILTFCNFIYFLFWFGFWSVQFLVFCIVFTSVINVNPLANDKPECSNQQTWTSGERL